MANGVGMVGAATHVSPDVVLAPFRKAHAATLASWVPTDDELRLLAPSTPPPLTATKILEWQRPRGHSYVGLIEGGRSAGAYAELNPVGQEPNHLWLGHCLVRTDLRGRGIGRAFVQSLLCRAFEELGAIRISLIVFPQNQAAVRCYLHTGFVHVGDEWHSFDRRPPDRLLRLEILA